MIKLRINPIVAKDLKDIKNFIAEDNPQMALKTVQTFLPSIHRIFSKSSKLLHIKRTPII